jgi:two-component system sensor histidine kinase UhpB
LKLSPTKGRNIYLIFKEAINNAVKHSGCTTINITLLSNNKHLNFSVRDNGKGFYNHSDGGKGLPNMKERVEECKGTIEIKSEPGLGTHILLSIPI